MLHLGYEGESSIFMICDLPGKATNSKCSSGYSDEAVITTPTALKSPRYLFSFAEYLAACCEDEGEENPP